MSQPFRTADEGSVYQIIWVPLSFKGSDFLPDYMMNLKSEPRKTFDIEVVLVSGRSLGEFSVDDEMTLGFFLRHRLGIINSSDRPSRSVLVSGEVHYDQAILRFFSVYVFS